ncbi:6e1f6bca-a2ff-4ab8-9397-fa392e43dd32 [Thermothielavioides terrestris]|uniref:6e1f6bca-a2ff-4ab8-9397-fa392e43dd32 n=1 Tax=Thermothielavioides terrestris TaxID=2587410 RepID=A0A446BSN3_9PEZI|nr:6e1f6bca-a2ff-4ab8-9397-fa392e43dd32 [Thermothielavioides terrestris]
MHFSHILLGLVTSASAIDVYFWNGGDCSGSATVCTGINPNVCCAGTDNTISFRGIPTNWHITGRGYNNGGCNNLAYQLDNNGQSWICLEVVSRYIYTGASYFFPSRRRAESGNCTETVKPDTLVLADGVTKYDIVGLDDAKLEELLALARSGVGPEGIPKEFQELRR